jgi:para-aminobenzoate synthetase component I
MNGLIKHLPDIKTVHFETVVLDQPFEMLAARFSCYTGTVLLLSGSSFDCSRYNILGASPWLELKGKGDDIRVNCLGTEHRVKHDPFSLVETLLKQFKFDEPSLAHLPVFSGFFGYLSYDLKDRIEILPRTCTDSSLPDICLFAPSIILIQDKKENTTTLCIPVLAHDTFKETGETRLENIRRFFFDRLSDNLAIGSFSIDSSGFRSSFKKSEYIRSVDRIIQYLKAGDIYQANLSQRFETGFKGDGYGLFLDLFERNPASFFSFIQAGDHTIVSTSPERFIKQDGKSVETRPIKGTIARGKTKQADDANGLRLSKSIKDDAELTMIVDLMRNDLSRVTRYGSVVVKEHKRIEPYENVFHLVSIVKGCLEENKNSVDLLRATFPGGSITGCPKIRSMEIIDELEPVKRHVYTGSIGYLSFHDTMDLSIAIRTATIANDTIFFSVGGGIVYDSDPEKEFQETLDKGKTLMESLSNASDKNREIPVKAWVDGKIIDEQDAVFPATSTGFQYGAGLFETIKVEKGNALHLDDHVARFNRSWQQVFGEAPPDITWRDVINLLVRENDYKDETLAVKILSARDEQKTGNQNYLAAFAKKYIHRLSKTGKDGLDLIIYPHSRKMPLADHKTMNYLYYHQAAVFAKRNRADEALILNPDQSVSETNTCNIIAVKYNSVILPDSDHVLSGVTLKAVIKIFMDKGYHIESKKLFKKDLYTYPNILLTNSLMGAVKVLSIDGNSIEHTGQICATINELLVK